MTEKGASWTILTIYDLNLEMGSSSLNFCRSYIYKMQEKDLPPALLKELLQLRALSNKLGSLPPATPPDSFLHEMTQLKLKNQYLQQRLFKIQANKEQHNQTWLRQFQSQTLHLQRTVQQKNKEILELIDQLNLLKLELQQNKLRSRNYKPEEQTHLSSTTTHLPLEPPKHQNKKQVLALSQKCISLQQTNHQLQIQISAVKAQLDINRSLKNSQLNQREAVLSQFIQQLQSELIQTKKKIVKTEQMLSGRNLLLQIESLHEQLKVMKEEQQLRLDAITRKYEQKNSQLIRSLKEEKRKLSEQMILLQQQTILLGVRNRELQSELQLSQFYAKNICQEKDFLAKQLQILKQEQLQRFCQPSDQLILKHQQLQLELAETISRLDQEQKKTRLQLQSIQNISGLQNRIASLQLKVQQLQEQLKRTRWQLQKQQERRRRAQERVEQLERMQESFLKITQVAKQLQHQLNQKQKIFKSELQFERIKHTQLIEMKQLQYDNKFKELTMSAKQKELSLEQIITHLRRQLERDRNNFERYKQNYKGGRPGREPSNSRSTMYQKQHQLKKLRFMQQELNQEKQKQEKLKHLNELQQILQMERKGLESKQSQVQELRRKLQNGMQESRKKRLREVLQEQEQELRVLVDKVSSLQKLLQTSKK